MTVVAATAAKPAIRHKGDHDHEYDEGGDPGITAITAIIPSDQAAGQCRARAGPQRHGNSGSAVATHLEPAASMRVRSHRLFTAYLRHWLALTDFAAANVTVPMIKGDGGEPLTRRREAPRLLTSHGEKRVADANCELSLCRIGGQCFGGSGLASGTSESFVNSERRGALCLEVG